MFVNFFVFMLSFLLAHSNKKNPPAGGEGRKMETEKVLEGINRYFEKGDEEGLHRAMRSLGDGLVTYARHRSCIDKVKELRSEIVNRELGDKKVPFSIITDILVAIEMDLKLRIDIPSVTKKLYEDEILRNIFQACYRDYSFSMSYAKKQEFFSRKIVEKYGQDVVDENIEKLCKLGVLERSEDDVLRATELGDHVSFFVEYPVPIDQVDVGFQ